jgi:hypothetical protein
MDPEEIKALRHSFTNPHREDMPKPKVNKFGHTVLGEEKPLDNHEIELKIDEFGALNAQPKQSLFESLEFQKWAEKQPISNTTEQQLEEDCINPEPVQIQSNRVNIADLISELDDMDGTTERKQTENHQMKRCANEKCLYALPKDATFCLKCGTYQAPKFCTECGYKFPGMEKFCPDCGNKR